MENASVTTVPVDVVTRCEFESASAKPQFCEGVHKISTSHILVVVDETDAVFSNPRLAAIYDIFDGARDDLPPYLDIIDELRSKTAVDLGCGTGELALLLNSRGLQVIGVDPAQASIDVAKSKPNAHEVEWIVGVASSLPAIKVDLVVMTGNVAQSIVEPNDWHATLYNVWDVLQPGGHFVFETRNPVDQGWNKWNEQDSFKSIEIPGIGRVDGWVELTEVDFPLISFRWTYKFHADGNVLASDSTLRFRSLEEVVEGLEQHKFAVREIRDAPDRPGKEHVIIAERAL